MKIIIAFTFCCDNLWKSKFMALEKPEKLKEFFSPTLWPPCWNRAEIKGACIIMSDVGLKLLLCSTIFLALSME